MLSLVQSFRGGFPALYSSEMSARVFFPNYIATYLERNVRNIVAVTDLRDFSRFVRAAALRSGSMLSYADLARDVGIAPNTAKAWISILESSGVVRLVEKFYINKTSRIVKSPTVPFSYLPASVRSQPSMNSFPRDRHAGFIGLFVAWHIADAAYVYAVFPFRNACRSP